MYVDRDSTCMAEILEAFTPYEEYAQCGSSGWLGKAETMTILGVERLQGIRFPILVPSLLDFDGVWIFTFLWWMVAIG